VRDSNQNAAEQTARKAFALGLAHENGVLIKGLFSKEDKTYASIWYPENHIEAEYALLSRNIKLSVNTSQVFKIVTVQSDEEWLRLANQYSAKQSQKILLFE